MWHTRGRGLNPWARWAGAYLQCPLSELLVYAGYASAVLDEPGLTARERWRLEGVDKFLGGATREDVGLLTIGHAGDSLRYDGTCSMLSRFDEALEAIWMAPPAE